jgi:hypothetical protein
VEFLLEDFLGVVQTLDLVPVQIEGASRLLGLHRANLALRSSDEGFVFGEKVFGRVGAEDPDSVRGQVQFSAQTFLLLKARLLQLLQSQAESIF